ncbi:MAG: thioesterase family protein [bacterium]|nr:thioesterase family protein [bacterium]
MSEPFRYPYTIGLHDTDAAGILYSANIIRICMIAYEALLDDIGYGLPRLFRRRTFGLPVVHIEADFVRPMTAGQKVTVTARVERFGDRSYRMAYEVLDEERECTAKAATVHVCVDPQTRRAMEIPEDFRTALGTYA